MKYILLNEDQIALFNLRTSKIKVEQLEVEESSFSKYYYFMKELDNEVETDLIRKDISERKDDLNRKLLLISE